jgi:hypothetical protein
VRVWPDAREAVAWVRPASNSDDEAPIKAERGTVLSDEHRARSARRAKGEARRYATANRLAFLHTLTFAGMPGARCAVTGDLVMGAATDRRCEGDGTCSCGRPVGGDGFDQAMRQGENFVRRLRRARGGENFAYLLVAEPHKDGHWHLHVALPFQVPSDRLSALWGLGRVDDGFRPEDRERFRSFEDQAAAAGGYAGKYLGKSLEVLGAAAVNRQTYRVAEGFDVVEVLLLAPTDGDAFSFAWQLCGRGELSASWTSKDSEEWQGPATWWWRFAWSPG